MLSPNAQRKRRNSARVNLVLSLVFHTVAIVGVTFVAAREGLLGRQFKEFAVTIVPKTQEDPAPEESPEPPVAEAKTQSEALDELPPPTPPPEAAPREPLRSTPPPAAAPPPPAAVIPSFVFTDGARATPAVNDPVGRFRSRIEYLLQSSWHRPGSISDPGLVTEVEVGVDPRGRLAVRDWKRLSGDRTWDDSVRAVFSKVTEARGEPPEGFPETFLVRFDVVPGDSSF